MMSVYFSAILSTADSCLMAASGNVLTDIISVFRKKPFSDQHLLRLSQWLTLCLGLIAIVLASMMENVLSMMLYSYAFMVSGLLIPLLAAVFFKQTNSKAAMMAMLGGGSTTLYLILFVEKLPLGLDANLFGISVSLILFVIGINLFPNHKEIVSKI
jgi:SSS family solute:Na+ symporter